MEPYERAEPHFEKLELDSGCCGLVTKLCLTLCDPMNCSPPGSSMGFLRQEITGVDCHFLQGIFPTQGSNPACLLHRQADSLPLNHLGSPR